MELNGLLEYAHGMVIRSSSGLVENGRTEELACGIWTVRDVIGHLTTFKHLTENVISTFIGNTNTPYLDLMLKLGPDKFGEAQVATRRGFTYEVNLEEYEASHRRIIALLSQIPETEIRRPGTLPWYGNQYGLDDFILYTDFGHQIEHASQLALLRDQPVADFVNSKS